MARKKPSTSSRLSKALARHPRPEAGVQIAHEPRFPYDAGMSRNAVQAALQKAATHIERPMQPKGKIRKRSADGGARDLVTIADSWMNLTTGMGDITRDKLLSASFNPLAQITFGELESLYYGDDMAELIVDELPDEAFRRGFKLEGPNANDGQELLDQLGATQKIRDGWGWARLWGGAVLVLGIDDGVADQTKPLNVEAVRGIKFINVVDRRYVNPVSYYEEALGPDFGEPSVYEVTPAFGSRVSKGTQIHETRLIKFKGTKIDSITTRRLAGWSYSALQRPYDVLRIFASAFQAAGQLATDAGQAIFEVDNLIQQLASSQSAAIQQRFTMLDMQRWSGRMILVDKDKENFRREGVQITGVDKLLEHFEMRLAAAARMPVTKLMGRAPAGMDATGEGDAKQWHERVKAAQSGILDNAIGRFLNIATAGKWLADKANKIVWASMQEPNDKEEAEVELIEAQTWKIYNDMGTVSGEQVALVQFCDEPIEEVLDEDALKAVIAADYELAKNPPAPAPAAPGAPQGAPNGPDRGQEPPPPGGKTAPDAAGR